jgi:hypothetical protein
LRYDFQSKDSALLPLLRAIPNFSSLLAIALQYVNEFHPKKVAISRYDGWYPLASVQRAMNSSISRWRGASSCIGFLSIE